MCLAAVKDYASIVVANMKSSDPIDKIMQGACDGLKMKNPTYTFTAPMPVTINGSRGLRVDANLTKEGIPLRHLYIA